MLVSGLLVACFALGHVSGAPVLNARWSSDTSTSTEWISYDLASIKYFTPFLDTPSVAINDSTAYAQLASSGRKAVLPYTVMSSNASTIDEGIVSATVAMYEEVDDVWSTAFLSTVYVIGTSSSKTTLTSDACAWLLSKGTTLVVTSGITDASACTCLPHTSVAYPSKAVPQGPYLATYGYGSSSLELFPVNRLYVDVQDAFLIGTYASPDLSRWYPFELSTRQNNYIPVPSRLYSLGDTRPLAGWRVGVKDLYGMNGVVTTAGDRQFGATYGTANSTCYAVQRLVDLGAVVVGKTKTAPFASGEEGQAWQWYMYPLNPRGDGFFTCSASSSGSGCAISAYDWLDFAIGTDTGESVRRPSAVNGVYGNRPTEFMISLDGVIPLAMQEDTAGCMTRDPKKFQTLVKNWYAQSNLTLPDLYEYPKKVYFPTDYFNGITPDALAVVNEFLGKMESTYGMTRQDLNFTELIFAQNATWSNSSNLLTEEGHYQFEYLQYEYILAFMAQNEGRFPSYDTQWRPQYQKDFANLSQNLWNESRFAAALEPKNELVAFINSQFFKEDNATCSDSLFVYDIGFGGMPYYRETDLNMGRGDFFSSNTNDTLWIYAGGISPAITAPDYVVPIGSVKYKSNVSLIEEELPVTLNFITRPSCDFTLVNLFSDMSDKGLLKTVKTGRTLF